MQYRYPMAISHYKFYRQTEQIDEVIEARHDNLQDWKADPRAYFLIRINPKKSTIEVGLATYDHIIRKRIWGRYAVEIYNTIVKHKLLSRLEHAAYLGKELYKAEMALRYGLKYRQDFPLDFPMKEKVKLEKCS